MANALGGILANYGVQTAMDSLQNALNGTFHYGTGQADSAYQQNQQRMMQNSHNQQNYENQQYANRSVFDTNLANQFANTAANRANAAANANSARQAGMNTLDAINRVYSTAGDRLGQQSANTMNTLSGLAASMGNLFR